MAAIPIEKDAVAGPVPIEDLARVAAQRGEPDRAIAALQKLLSLPYNGGLGALAAHTRAAPGSIQCSIRSGTIRVFRNSPSRPRRRCRQITRRGAVAISSPSSRCKLFGRASHARVELSNGYASRNCSTLSCRKPGMFLPEEL
jgi:hypothetical protein